MIGEEDSRDSVSDKPRKGVSNKRLPSAKHLCGNALERALRNVHHAADEAWRLLSEATIEGRASKIQVLLSIHNKAVDALFTAESAYREELERRKILIPLAFAKETTAKVITAIVSRLNVLPQNAAARCNPNNPHLAMSVLDEECVAIMKFAQQSIS